MLNCRKRDQLQSMIGYIEPELNRLLKVYSEEFNETNNCSGSSSAKKVTVVEFGSGSGHLSLVLAHRHPLIHFILVERKEYTISVARHRVSECGLQNVSMFTGELSDLDSFLNGRQISLGIGLHCCGLFTDMALDVCLSHNASFVISPCCYGQIGRPPVSTLPSALDDDSKTLECILHSRSNRIFKLHPDQLRPISSTADWIYNFLDSDSVLLSDQDVLSQPNFLLAKRCMMAVDVDRLCRVCEHSESQLEVRSECDSESQITRIGGRYFCRVDSLRPLACTPKNNVIIGRFVSS